MRKSVRFTALLTVLLMLLPLVFSCGKKESEIAVAYGDAVMSEKLYIYELCRYKSELLAGLGSEGVDIPEMWSQDIGGVTVDDFYYTQCQVNIYTMLFFADYAINHNGALTETQLDGVQEQLDTIVSTLGSKGAVNKYLEKYGINYDLYREYLGLYQLYVNGVELAYADGGDYQITEEAARKYYEENFITVKHYAVGTDIAGADQEGNYIYYTDEEKAEKQQKIDSTREQIRNGADFDALYLESEDKQAELYPDGYTITKGVLSEEMSGYEEIALSLEIGEVGEWEKENFGHYFIKRIDLLDSEFKNCQNHILPILVERDMAERIVANYDNFTINQDILDSYNLASVAVMN